MSPTSKTQPLPPAPPPGPVAPKNPGFVTLTVDGKEVVAKPGTNLIEAARSVGLEIPYFCYHPRLTVAANCRMCLVEASNTMPGKLVPACQHGLSEGLVVKTTTSLVKAEQKQVMEYLLLNHPVDCAICDQAGECKLQDYYMRYDHASSRLEGPKVLRRKRKALSDDVVIDQERCVLCTRCVRFMAEVAKAPQLGVFGRGSHEVVDVAPGTEKLESNYTGNIVDLCPVGALLSRDFRFRARAWFLSTAPSVCTGCARGCNTWTDFMGQDLYRLRPRENEQINKSWMCDHGRTTYKAHNQHRVLQSALGRGGELREAAAVEAAKYVAMKVQRLSQGVSVVVSPVASNEDLLAVLHLAKNVLQASEVFVSGRPSGKGDGFLLTADRNPNRRGLESIAKGFSLGLKPLSELAERLDSGAVTGVLAFGGDIHDDDEGGLVSRAQKLELFAVAAATATKMTAAANAILATATHFEDEGSFTQLDGITQRFRRVCPPRGEALPLWKWAVLLGQELRSELRADSSKEVFSQLSASIPELKDFAWDAQAPLSQRRPGIQTMPAAADGRPPGWREQGIPNLRGLSLPPQGS